MHILGKNLRIVNRYAETAYFMQKDSRKFGTLNYSPYLCRQKETAQAFEKVVLLQYLFGCKYVKITT